MSATYGSRKPATRKKFARFTFKAKIPLTSFTFRFAYKGLVFLKNITMKYRFNDLFPKNTIYSHGQEKLVFISTYYPVEFLANRNTPVILPYLFFTQQCVQLFLLPQTASSGRSE
jgi:hypothetical protein